MNVVGLISCYREGRLVQSAIESLLRVEPDKLLIYEGPAGEPLDADVPESELGILGTLGGATVVHNEWATDGNKRDAMLKAVHRMNLDPPVWGVIVDGDEVLGNGEYVRDILQSLVWQDEADEEAQPWMRYPLRVIEPDGAIVVATSRIVRLDLLRSYEASTSAVTNIHGVKEGWGHVVPDARVWLDHFLLAVDAGRMAAWPPLPCEPYIAHRSHLRHPLRRGLRMHKQEAVELAKLDG